MLSELRHKRHRLRTLERELRLREAANSESFRRWKQKRFASPSSLVWFFAAGALAGAGRKREDDAPARSSTQKLLRSGLIGWRLMSGGLP